MNWAKLLPLYVKKKKLNSFAPFICICLSRKKAARSKTYTTELKFTTTHSTSIDIMQQTDNAVIIVIIDKQTKQAANCLLTSNVLAVEGNYGTSNAK
jgi:hypothetical protein